MKAKKKPFDLKTLADIELDLDSLKTSIKTSIVNYKYPPQKPQGKVFKDKPVKEMVDQVVKLLREEAKVI